MIWITGLFGGTDIFVRSLEKYKYIQGYFKK